MEAAEANSNTCVQWRQEDLPELESCISCMYSAPAMSKYKLLQLRQCLSGEALNAIKDLGHSATAYDTAKERLERKFGGKRCQFAIYFEDLEKFRQIRPEHTKDLEQFPDLLEITVIKLKEADQPYEYGNGSLYSKLYSTTKETHQSLFRAIMAN